MRSEAFIQAKLLLVAMLTAALPSGIPASRTPSQPTLVVERHGCWVQLNYRPLHLGPLELPPNHTYLFVRDQKGLRWIFEGRPEFTIPNLTAGEPWGRLRAYATVGTRGYRSTDDAVTDYRQGERRSVSCSVVDRLRSQVEGFDAAAAIPYYPAGANSNYVTRWLLNQVHLDVFGEPPNSLNWSRGISDFRRVDAR